MYLMYISTPKNSSILAWEIPWTENPDSSDGKETDYSAGDPGLIPELGRSPGEGNGSILAWKIP